MTWSLPNITKDTLVIGDSNLCNITHAQTDNIQIESFPGAQFRQIKYIIDNYSHLGTPKNIILSVGINNRSSKPSNTSIPEMKNVISSISKNFPNSKIYFPLINYSNNLPGSEISNLDKINQAIKSLSNVTVIDKLISGKFYTNPSDRTNIHWSTNTANSLLSNWLSHLN